jgi:hypothetical protein
VFYTGNVPTASNEVRSRNHCCREKAINITYSECVSVALVIQHAMRMRPIVLSSLACLAVPYFSTYLIKGKVFGEKILNIQLYTDFLYNVCLKTNSVRCYHKCISVFM